MRHWKLTDILRAGIIAGLLLWAIPSHATEANFNTLILNNVGRPLVGVSVTFCNHHTSSATPCTDTITIYSDVEGAHPIANPAKTDGYGNVFVFMDPGTYDYSVTGNGVVPTTYRGIQPTLSGGSVTSVAMTGDNVLFSTSISGSPITGSGTFNLATSLKNESAYTVLGNCTNSSATPTFCSINAAMLGAAAPGSDTQVLFNDGGAINAGAGITYNKTTQQFAVTSSNTSGDGIFTVTDTSLTGSSQYPFTIITNAVNMIHFHRPTASVDASLSLDNSADFDINVANGTGQLLIEPSVLRYVSTSSSGEIEFYSSSATPGGHWVYNLQSGLMNTPYAELAPGTLAAAGTCNGAAEGKIASINDSDTNTWGATIGGSSTNHVMGYCDGTNWTVMGK